jgi:hypothetical protein
MNQGRFYFLVDQYFIDFPDPYLMKNKEIIEGIIHDRPCFYAHKESDEIYWMIPISSKIDKYRKVYQRNIDKYNRCDTIVFGKILDQERVFLIQNMCPATLEYIGNEYYYSFVSHIPIGIDESLGNDVIQKAKRVLMLVRNGGRLVFPDILKIEKELKSKFK